MVGLERTFYNVSESVGELEICGIVYRPVDLDCPISFPFIVALNTRDGTAGNHHSPNLLCIAWLLLLVCQLS